MRLWPLERPDGYEDRDLSLETYGEGCDMRPILICHDSRFHTSELFTDEEVTCLRLSGATNVYTNTTEYHYYPPGLTTCNDGIGSLSVQSNPTFTINRSIIVTVVGS